MKTKRWLAILLTAVLMLGCLPGSLALAEPCAHTNTHWEEFFPGQEPAQNCLETYRLHLVCTDCGARMGKVRDIPGPHSYGEWVTEKEATCSSTGMQSRYCTLCHNRQEKAIAKLPHKGSDWTTIREATCTEKGLEEGRCLDCGATVTRKPAMLPHTVNDWIVTLAATCTKSGIRKGTCSVCGTRVTEEIPYAGHVWDEGKITRAPKCETAGTKDTTCTVCGAVKSVTLSLTGHQWGEWEVIVEPKGINRGKRVHRCTVCKTSASEYFYAEGTLAEGSKGEEVRTLNQMLAELGFSKQKVTDSYTNLTKAAVAAFQKANGLRQSGVADPETIAQIEQNWNKANETGN